MNPQVQRIAELESLVERQAKTISELESMVHQLLEEIARLKKQVGGGGSPLVIKASRPPKDNKARKKRNQGHSRKLCIHPDEVHFHTAEICPDCGHALSGGWVHDVREVIDIPPVKSLIIHHVRYARKCGVCKKRVLPSLNLSEQVLGRHRVSIRLMSIVAYLCEICRLPRRVVQSTLKTLFGVDISTGEICEILHSMAQKGEKTYQQLQDQVRGSPFVHADETGWREDGKNGYLWHFGTPDVSLFVYDKSRGHQVPEEFLGNEFKGVLVSDFYCGYYFYLGEHQRCWVHFLRDLHALKKEFAEDPSVLNWAESIHDLYLQAREFSSENKKHRVEMRKQLQQRLVELASPYSKIDCPQRILAARLIRFEPEMFTFVEHVGVPSDNNAAERAIRPAVISRKISGGTRSPHGSQTKSALMSLFSTWKLQNLDGIQQCCNMLRENT